jgi:hypothetical protein
MKCKYCGESHGHPQIDRDLYDACEVKHLKEMARKGKLHPPKTMFFRQDVGTAKGEDGTEYEMTVNMGGATPIIRSKKTGKWFTLSWQDIIDMAIERGINEEGECLNESSASSEGTS